MKRDRSAHLAWATARWGSPLIALAPVFLTGLAVCVFAKDMARAQDETETSRAPASEGLDASESKPALEAFPNTQALLDAIVEGTYAERAGIAEQIERAQAIPEPLVVEFVRGTEVPGEALPALTDFALAVAGRPDIVVDLVGCSDPSGRASVNERISTARARSVAERLQKLGLKTDQIRQVEGRGELCEVQERMVRITPARREVSAEARDQGDAD